MGRKRHSAEEIVNKLRQASVAVVGPVTTGLSLRCAGCPSIMASGVASEPHAVKRHP